MMKRQMMIDMAKTIFPIEITQGEEFLDQAVFFLSKRFIQAIDPQYPMPESENELPEEPWFTVIMSITERILQGRSGKIHFTEKSFPFLAGK